MGGGMIQPSPILNGGNPYSQVALTLTSYQKSDLIRHADGRKQSWAKQSKSIVCN